MKWFTLSIISLAVLGAAACEEDSQGIALEFAPTATEGAALSAPLTLAEGFEATRLEALVREVKVLPGKDDDKESKEEKFKAKGDFWVDALDPDDSTIPEIPLPADTYKKVEFKFEKPSAGEGIQGTDAAIALDATIDGTKVQVRIAKSDKVTLRHVDGIALANGGTSTFLIDLDVPGWFDGVDVTTLEADADGVVLIDSQTNKSAYDKVLDNLKATIKLLRKP